MNLTCSRCKVEKSCEAFSKSARRKTGRQPWCKECAHEDRKQWARNNKERTRHHRLIYSHRITSEQFDAMVAAQENRCKICSKFFENATQMKVDHDHACCNGARGCGKCVRGILCSRCNGLLGALEDKEFVAKATIYLNNASLV